jgi:hypothetical protein
MTTDPRNPTPTTTIPHNPETQGEHRAYLPKRPRKFVPLNPEKAREWKGKAERDGNVQRARRLRGVVFDVDGTLW